MNIEELKRLAEAATPGPWKWLSDELLNELDMPALISDGVLVCDFGNEEQYYPTEGTPPSEADAAYIAAANPATMVALLDRLAAAEKDAVCFRYWVREAASAPGAMANLIQHCTTEADYRRAISGVLDAAKSATDAAMRGPAGKKPSR